MLELIKDLGMLYPRANSKQKYRYGLYKCFCGNEFKAQSREVKRGNIQSCKCLRLKNISISQTTHGMSNHRLYDVWKDMIKRCENTKSRDYINYGGRGISVCERWLKVENFIEDMYPTFQEGLTLDRKNTNGNYELSNCRWATRSIQARNKRLICKTNKSGYRGVSFCNKILKWHSQISVSNKKIHLGFFDNKIDAAKAYDKYVIDNNLEHTINGPYNV